MIHVNVYEGEHTVVVDIEGHSGYEERGKDIVCAGVSALHHAFRVTAMARGIHIRCMDKNGFSRMEIDADDIFNYDVGDSLLNMMLRGMLAITGEYPEYLSVRFSDGEAPPVGFAPGGADDTMETTGTSSILRRATMTAGETAEVNHETTDF